LDIRTSSNNIVLSDGDGNPRLVVDGSGNMQVGFVSQFDGSNPARICVDGIGTDGRVFNTKVNTSGSANHLNFYNSTGQVGSVSTSGSSTSYNTSSDYRLKENVVYDWDATTRFKQLKPARFNFIADADTTVDGFLAHEAQAVVPECVTGTKDAVDADGVAVMQGIDQSKLVPLLVKTIQELEARITALENL
jgi:ABC-type transport system substrate-binding protein